MFRSLFRMLKHIALAVIAIVATVCTVEVGLRGRQLYLRTHGGDSLSCGLTPAPCPITFQQLAPLTQTTRVSTETGEPIAIRTNSLGLRGPEMAIPKPAETYRIVCLGDDATFASDIAEEGTFAAIVQSELGQETSRPIEVINAGLPGYCPLLSLAWARQRLASLQPDLVILCCDESDVADDRTVRPLARFADDGVLQGVCHPASATREQSLIQALEAEFQIAALLGTFLGSYLHGEELPAGGPDDWAVPSTVPGTAAAIHIRQTWEPIAPLRDLCQELAADFVVALVPSRDVAPISLTGTPDEVSRLLAEITEEYGVPYLDVTAEFSPQAAPQPFLSEGGALSAAGHMAFAELLSWAIVHRDAGVSVPEESAAPITPAVAVEPAVTPSTKNGGEPSPLPSPGRRARTDETVLWSQ